MISERVTSVINAMTLSCQERATEVSGEQPCPRSPVLHTLSDHIDTSEEVISMGYTKDQYVAAAKVPPSKRTAEQQAMVSQGSNLQEVRNADFEAKRRDR
jgi:hypothetical protein